MFLRGFRRAYRRRSLFPRGLITRREKVQAIAVLLKICLHLLVLSQASKRHNKSNARKARWETRSKGGAKGGIFCLQVDGSITGGLIGLGGGEWLKCGSLRYSLIHDPAIILPTDNSNSCHAHLTGFYCRPRAIAPDLSFLLVKITWKKCQIVLIKYKISQ